MAFLVNLIPFLIYTRSGLWLEFRSTNRIAPKCMTPVSMVCKCVGTVKCAEGRKGFYAKMLEAKKAKALLKPHLSGKPCSKKEQ